MACEPAWTGPRCESCAVDYFDDGGDCINSRQAPCIDVAPLHATAVLDEVTVTYTSAGGWAPAPDCAFSCDLDFALEAGGCIDTRVVPCVDAAPPNASAIPAEVFVTYTSAGGWTIPSDCAFLCFLDFVYESGACVHTRQVPCADAAPAHGTSTVTDVTVEYTTALGWAPPSACSFTCDPGWLPEVGACVEIPLPTSCAALLAIQPGTPDGVYPIDPDGLGPLDAWCDMTTDGGGWTLVLNYTRAVGASPATQVRSLELPLLGGALGADEVGTAFWGHAGTALLSRLPFTEVRFFGQSKNHLGGRVMHFRTDLASAVSYFRTGLGDLTGIEASYTALDGHAADLPGTAIHFTQWGSSMGDESMTAIWGHGWTGGNDRIWVIGTNGYWCVDDGPDNGCGTAWDTVHRVYVR